MHGNILAFAGPNEGTRPFNQGLHVPQRVFFPHAYDWQSLLGTGGAVTSSGLELGFQVFAPRRQFFAGDGASLAVQGQVFRRVDRGLSVVNLTDSSSGSSTSQVDVLFDHFADGASVGTGETDLYSDTIPAGQLANNGEKIVADYGIILNNNGSTRTLRVYFGGTAIFDSGALAIGAGGADPVITVLVIRKDASTVRYYVQCVAGTLTTQPAVGELGGLTLSNTQILKITGQAGVTGVNGDITATLGHVEWKAAA